MGTQNEARNVYFTGCIRFYIPETRVHPVKRGYLRRFLPGYAADNGFANASGLRYACKTLEAIGNYVSRRLQASPSPRLDVDTLERRYLCEQDTLRTSLRVRLDGRHGGHFVLRSTANATTGTLPTQVGVVELYPPTNPTGLFLLDHGLHQFVPHSPSASVADSQPSHELHRGDGVLRLREEVNGLKPECKRQFRGVKKRTTRQGNLLMARIALKRTYATVPDTAELSAIARRTDKAVRPPETLESFFALLFTSVFLKKLVQTHSLLSLDGILHS